MDDMDLNDLRERLAAEAHNVWNGWMKYMFSKCQPYWNEQGDQDMIIPNELACRWIRQMQTPYDDLSGSEKTSDREIADKYMDIVKEWADEQLSLVGQKLATREKD